MTAVVWCAFALMLPSAVLALLAFRRLVEIEFTQFHDQWLTDGKPVGGAMSRKAASFWRSGFSTRHAYNTWLVSTPQWVRESPEALAALRRFRLGTVVMVIGVLASIAVALLIR
jgi:hypothetical protein